MGEVRFAAVRSRAFREARAEARLDSPVRIVTGIISPFASAAIVWWATGSWAWGGIAGVGVLLFVLAAVFTIKLFTVPVAMVNEANAKADKIGSDLGQKVAALEERIAVLTAPPQQADRDPDGVYQLGNLVAKMTAPEVRRGTGVVFCRQLRGGPDLNILAEAEFREFRVLIDPQGWWSPPQNATIQVYGDVTMKIIGLRR